LVLDRDASTTTAEPRADPRFSRFDRQRFVHAEIDDPGCMFGTQTASHPFIVPNVSTRTAAFLASSSPPSLLRQVDSIPSGHIRVRDRDRAGSSVAASSPTKATDRDDPPTEREILEQWRELARYDVDELLTYNHSYSDPVDQKSERGESKDRAPASVPSVSECAHVDRDAIGADLEFRYLCDETVLLLDAPLFRAAKFVGSGGGGDKDPTPPSTELSSSSSPSPLSLSSLTFEIATPLGLGSRLREISDAAKDRGVNDLGVASSAPSPHVIAAVASMSFPHLADAIAAAVAAPRVVTLDCSAFVQILARLRREQRGERFAHLRLTVNPRLAQIDARIVVMRFTDTALRTHIEGSGAPAEINQFLLLPECVPPAFATAETPATGLDDDGVRTLTLRDWARRRRVTVAKRMRELAPDRYFKAGARLPPRSYLHGQLAQLAFASDQEVAFTTLGRSCALALCA
jgi:hypothetical protein